MFTSFSGIPSGDTIPRDCKEVYQRGRTQDGVYTIAPNCPNTKPFKVFCDMKNGQCIVFQRRRHAQLDFNRNWTDYEEGFGDPQYEHWLGLKKINCLTFSVCAAELRIDMTNYKGIHKYAIYSSIAVHNAANKYRLDLGAYSGTAGDGMRACRSDFKIVGHLITVMVCHSQHLTGIMIKVQETVLSSPVLDGGTIAVGVQT